MLEQITSILRGRSGEAARHSVCRGRGSFLLSASVSDNRQFTHAAPYHRPANLPGYNRLYVRLSGHAGDPLLSDARLVYLTINNTVVFGVERC